MLENLLIVSSRYPHEHDSISSSFVYSQVERLRKNIAHIDVIATTPYVPHIYAELIGSRRKRDSLANDYSDGNVSIFFTKQLAIPIEHFRLKRGKVELKAAHKICKNNDINPDLIHAHFTFPSGYVALELSRSLGVPYIVTAHGYDIYDLPFQNDQYFTIIEDVVKNASKIITVSSRNEKILVEKFKIKKDKIIVIPNGFDKSLFKIQSMESARNELGLSDKKRVMLCIGNLLKVKGFDILIRSVHKMKDELTDVEFHIVGDGPEKDTLEKMIQDLKLAETIHLVGAVPHDLIPKWIAACNGLVIPSRDEGVPTVLFESIACGTPVIGTSVGGIPDIIDPMKNGILIESENLSELGKTLVQFQDLEWDEDMIREHAQQYEWGNLSKRVEEVYQQVLNEVVD